MSPTSLNFCLRGSLMLLLLLVKGGCGFTTSKTLATSYNNNGPIKNNVRFRPTAPLSPMQLQMAQISEQEAKKSIDKVVAALRKDKEAKSELGNLQSVNNILGFGMPVPDQVAVRFNASFKKGGMGRSAIPLPFGLGQTNESEGRGTMVGQVKASVDANTGKVISCSVFRDLGYGRAFNLKV